MGNNPQGVKQIYKAKGTFRTNYSFNPASGDSSRFDMQNPPTNFEFTGYFRGDGDDTVSCKIRGGRHTDSAEEDGCCYIPQFPTNGGPMEYQVECPHPDNHDCGATRIANSKGIGRPNFRGFKVACWNTSNNCVHWEAWEDQGNSGSQDTPTIANQWVKLSEHTDCSGDCGDISSPLLEPKGNTSQATWRIDECGVNEDDGVFISIVEIEPGVLDTGGTTETPGGGEIPEPEQPDVTIAQDFIDVWHVIQDAGESCTTGGNITPADLEDLWDLSPPTPATYLDLFTGSNVRAGINARTEDSRLINTIPKEFSFTVQKFGTPTGNLKLVEYDLHALHLGTGNSVFVRQIGSNIDVGTLTPGVDTLITIEDLSNEERITVDHAFLVEYVGGDVNNKIRVRQTDVDYIDSGDTLFTYASSTGVWTHSPSRDAPWKIRGTAA